MLFRRFESKGLAHYSYLVGDQSQAVVIDPRRDCAEYIQMSGREGMRITHVLETHRNEDYVSGRLSWRVEPVPPSCTLRTALRPTGMGSR